VTSEARDSCLMDLRAPPRLFVEVVRASRRERKGWIRNHGHARVDSGQDLDRASVRQPAVRHVVHGRDAARRSVDGQQDSERMRRLPGVSSEEFVEWCRSAGGFVTARTETYTKMARSTTVKTPMANSVVGAMAHRPPRNDTLMYVANVRIDGTQTATNSPSSREPPNPGV
jgi:hypothetical protein